MGGSHRTLLISIVFGLTLIVALFFAVRFERHVPAVRVLECNSCESCTDAFAEANALSWEQNVDVVIRLDSDMNYSPDMLEPRTVSCISVSGIVPPPGRRIIFDGNGHRVYLRNIVNRVVPNDCMLLSSRPRCSDGGKFESHFVSIGKSGSITFSNLSIFADGGEHGQIFVLRGVNDATFSKLHVFSKYVGTAVSARGRGTLSFQNIELNMGGADYPPYSFAVSARGYDSVSVDDSLLAAKGSALQVDAHEVNIISSSLVSEGATAVLFSSGDVAMVSAEFSSCSNCPPFILGGSAKVVHADSAKCSGRGPIVVVSEGHVILDDNACHISIVSADGVSVVWSGRHHIFGNITNPLPALPYVRIADSEDVSVTGTRTHEMYFTFDRDEFGHPIFSITSSGNVRFGNLWIISDDTILSARGSQIVLDGIHMYSGSASPAVVLEDSDVFLDSVKLASEGSTSIYGNDVTIFLSGQDALCSLSGREPYYINNVNIVCGDDARVFVYGNLDTIPLNAHSCLFTDNVSSAEAQIICGISPAVPAG